MSQMLMPRIRARVGRAEENGKEIGWGFEVSLWDITGTKKLMEPVVSDVFDTEDLANQAMKECVRYISDECVKLAGGEPTNQYLDLKNGCVLRPWENHS